MVVDKGFEPFRCSPSDHSPGFIKPSRIPMLATIFGSKGGIRTHGFGALQAPALDHSATLLLLVLMVRIELTTSSLPRMRDYHCATSAITIIHLTKI